MFTINTRSLGLYLLMFLILFQGISGVSGGGALMLDPSGSTIQLSLNLLKGTPFHSYLIPGFFLLTVLGIFPLIVLYGLWNLKGWSLTGSLLVGVFVIIWILVEITMVGYISQPPLQLIYGIIGVVILLLVQFGHIAWQSNESPN